MKRVGIITFQESNNYGALLQAFALKTAVDALGCQAEIINYHSRAKEAQYAIFSMDRSLLVNLNTLLSAGITKRIRKKSNAFRREALQLSPKVIDREQLRELNERYDKFICGSDQIWNPKSIKHDSTFFLDFVDDPEKRVAYAPSIGIPVIDEKDIDFFRDGIMGFRHLSVREKSGAELIRQHTGKEALVVLDPTQLLSREKWNALAGDNQQKKRYILLFMVGYSSTAVKLAKDLSKAKGLEVITPLKSLRDYKDGFKTFVCDPFRFLNIIKHADYVITTSFHGLMFSTIFQKQFLNVEKTAAKNEGASRIHDFLEMTGLTGRIYTGDIHQIDEPIDYASVNQIFFEKREESLRYLKNSLESQEGGQSEYGDKN